VTIQISIRQKIMLTMLVSLYFGSINYLSIFEYQKISKGVMFRGADNAL
jgi:hypothetical protein